MAMTANDAAVDDIYLTRHTGPPTRRARPDPTVWGRPTDGPISTQDLEGYEANGFLIIDELLRSEEVDRCREEVTRLRGDPELRRTDLVVLEPELSEVRSVFDVHRISDLFAKLLRSSRIADYARNILGSDVYIHQSRVNYKPQFGGAEFHWHSDFETWHAEDGMPRPRALSISIALTDNLPANGPLMIVPKSHMTFVSCPGGTPADFHRESLREKRPSVGGVDQENLKKLVDEGGIEQMIGPSGSAVMFDCNCLHGSTGNMSPYPRTNLFVVYNSVENSLREPYASAKPRPNHLASRDFIPVEDC
jgi:ectoine hydroxylase